MNKKVVALLILVLCIACAVTVLFMSKRFIKKKDMQERFQVNRFCNGDFSS